MDQKSEKMTKSDHVVKHRARHNKEIEFREFALFLALTLQERQDIFGFYTQQEFQKKYKVAAKTLLRWKLDPRFNELHESYLSSHRQFAAQVLEGLRNKATTEGNSDAARVWLQFVMGWVPNEKREVVVETPKVDAFE